jgi:hypothetical protein
VTSCLSIRRATASTRARSRNALTVEELLDFLSCMHLTMRPEVLTNDLFTNLLDTRAE